MVTEVVTPPGRVASLVAMPEYEFVIGDAFPATDPVARYVVTVGIIYNDWRRTMNEMETSAP